MGAVFFNPNELHGKRVTLKRGDEEVEGILLSENMKNADHSFVFQWKNAAGTTCVSPVEDEEVEEIRQRLFAPAEPDD